MSDECTCPQCSDKIPDTPEIRLAYELGWDAGYLARESGLALEEESVLEVITREEFEDYKQGVSQAILGLADALNLSADVLEDLDRRVNLALTGTAVALQALKGTALAV